MKKQFNTILEQAEIEPIFSFLKELTDKERRDLVPEIKKAGRELEKKFEAAVVREGDTTWSTPKPELRQQSHILRICSFVCAGNTEGKRFKRWNVPDTETINKILDWYCPSWFGEYINGLAGEEYPGVEYKEVIEWYQKGFLIPSPELVSKILTNAVFIRNKNKKGHIERLYSTDIIMKFPVTLQEHIWYLFEYPSNLHGSDRWITVDKDSKGDNNWKNFFKTFTQKGVLDRQRVLKETLLALNRNFNKILTGWFMDLFLFLEPTEEELIALQPELLSALSCVQSKPVNNILTIFKKLCTNKAFDTDNFIAQLPVLLSSETKGILIAAIAVLEKIAKAHKEKQEEICIQLCAVFLNKDEAVQTKAAKLITQYGTADSIALKTTLVPYADSMLMSVKSILQPYLNETIVSGERVQSVSNLVLVRPALIQKDHLIPEITSVDDLVFLAGQAFENNQSYHIDQLLNALVVLNKEITATIAEQLEPAFQRAYKVLFKPVSSMGNLDNLLALFFIEYGKYLSIRFPKETVRLVKLHDKNDKEDTKKAEEKSYYKKHLIPLEEWGKEHHLDKIFYPYLSLALTALEKIKTDDTLPFLSTPTHQPGWIDPKVLIQRVQHYQQAAIEPNDMDMQLALSRCALDDTTQVVELVKRELTAEYKDLFLFFLDKKAAPGGKFIHPSWWMTAGITRSPKTVFSEFKDFEYNKLPVAWLSGDFKWKAYIEEYQAYGSYDREKGDYNRYQAFRSRFKVEFPVTKSSVSAVPLLAECFYYISYSISSQDVRRIVLCFPNHSDVILAVIAGRYMHYSGLNEVYEASIVTTAIEAFQELNIEYSAMAHFFISVAMLNADKTVRAYSAGIWAEQISYETISSKEIGKNIGLMEKIEWGPLKRFTNLITSSMLGISSQHNQAAEEMIVMVLSQLDEKPIKDLKKLLEIYSEILALNSSKAATERIPQLEIWKQNANLKKVIQQLV